MNKQQALRLQFDEVRVNLFAYFFTTKMSKICPNFRKSQTQVKKQAHQRPHAQQLSFIIPFEKGC